MSRFGTNRKTYDRSGGAQTASSLFDAVIGKNDLPPATASSSMASSTVHRFGKASFTSSRPAKSAEPEEKKRKMNDDVTLFDDPFSFDHEPDGSPKKRGRPKGSTNKNNGKKTGRGPGRPKKSKELEDEFPAAKTTLSYAARKNQLKASKTQSSSQPTSSSNKTKQLSLDIFTNKEYSGSLNSIDRLRIFPKTKVTKPVVKKFFTSSQNSSELSDHNYS